MESEFEFLDIKSSMDKAGSNLKTLTHLNPEFETLNFQMFFGLSNSEIKSVVGPP